MHFVNNIDFKTRGARRVAHIVDNFANIANAGARGGVHFNDIDMAAIHNGFTMRAIFLQCHARRINRFGLIIQRARQNTRRGGFADPAHAGQHKAMRDTATVKRIGQGLHHGFLANEIVKIARPIFARQHLIAAIITAYWRGAIFDFIIGIGIGQHVEPRRIGGKLRRLRALILQFGIGMFFGRLGGNIIFCLFCHLCPNAARINHHCRLGTPMVRSAA